MDVVDWLRALGLGQYEDVFRENEIDGAVLTDLTEGDFEKLGVPMGHRKRLLKAIATLRNTEPAMQPESSAPSAPRDAAERRQLTVMFCDLVGSTAMSSRLDPEDMRNIIAAYHKCCARLITGSGGFVTKYMGDGVLAYFGYPQAHEHDAEHALRAGLAIVEAAPKLETSAGVPLHVRVGTATGIVVVGDLLGSGEAQERGVVGDTPNLAARLQTVAAPDSVVIAEGTRKLVGDMFELRDLGPQDLKGVAGPTRAYVALSESSRESRFDAHHAEGLTALVGRDEETDLLFRRWSKAKAGEGQVVLLSGEAGIGKSRLTAEFLQRLSGEPHQRLRYFCSPQHTDSALYPIIAHLERAAGLAREDDPKTRLDKLEARLTISRTSREDVALLAEMLSLPNDCRYPVTDFSPPQRRQKTLEALIAQIAAMARQTPTLMIFEDAHWADPSSLEVLSQLVDTVQAMRALLFVTFRPEFAAPWVGRPHVTTLSINRLTRRDVEALINRVAGNKRLPPGVQQDIVERADGVPLFVEEMTKAVLEAEGEGEAARTMASIPSSALAVPASLHASLMARLDRLGNAKTVAQIGAAIGREFSHDLLAAVAGETEAELVASLDRLVDAGSFIVADPRPMPPICSSTRLSRTPLTAHSCESPAARCTAGSPARSKAGFPKLRTTSRSFWRTTSRTPA
jgi:class 3 adenylate cyclase